MGTLFRKWSNGYQLWFSNSKLYSDGWSIKYTIFVPLYQILKGKERQETKKKKTNKQITTKGNKRKKERVVEGSWTPDLWLKATSPHRYYTTNDDYITAVKSLQFTAFSMEFPPATVIEPIRFRLTLSHFPASWNLYPPRDLGDSKSKCSSPRLLFSKSTIVLIWKTPACLKYSKTSNRAVENLPQRKQS